jgi:hypothetical protein
MLPVIAHEMITFPDFAVAIVVNPNDALRRTINRKHAGLSKRRSGRSPSAREWIDLFDMQDEIVARLANALNAQIIAAEARRAEQAPNPDSMDLYFQGLAWFYKGITRDNLAQAQSFFDRALTADPGNVDALGCRRARTRPRAQISLWRVPWRPSLRPRRSWPKPCPLSRIMRLAIWAWGLSTNDQARRTRHR